MSQRNFNRGGSRSQTYGSIQQQGGTMSSTTRSSIVQSSGKKKVTVDSLLHLIKQQKTHSDNTLHQADDMPSHSVFSDRSHGGGGAEWGGMQGEPEVWSSTKQSHSSQSDYGYSSHGFSHHGYNARDYASGGRNTQNQGVSSSSASDNQFLGRRKGPPPNVKIQDYLGRKPDIFPHKCSVCDVSINSAMAWTQHTTGIKHAQKSRTLLRLYPDWKPDAQPSPSGQNSNSQHSVNQSDGILGQPQGLLVPPQPDEQNWQPDHPPHFDQPWQTGPPPSFDQHWQPGPPPPFDQNWQKGPPSNFEQHWQPGPPPFEQHWQPGPPPHFEQSWQQCPPRFGHNRPPGPPRFGYNGPPGPPRFGSNGPPGPPRFGSNRPPGPSQLGAKKLTGPQAPAGVKKKKDTDSSSGSQSDKAVAKAQSSEPPTPLNSRTVLAKCKKMHDSLYEKVLKLASNFGKVVKEFKFMNKMVLRFETPEEASALFKKYEHRAPVLDGRPIHMRLVEDIRYPDEEDEPKPINPQKQKNRKLKKERRKMRKMMEKKGVSDDGQHKDAVTAQTGADLHTAKEKEKTEAKVTEEQISSVEHQDNPKKPKETDGCDVDCDKAAPGDSDKQVNTKSDSITSACSETKPDLDKAELCISDKDLNQVGAEPKEGADQHPDQKTSIKPEDTAKDSNKGKQQGPVEQVKSNVVVVEHSMIEQHIKSVLNMPKFYVAIEKGFLKDKAFLQFPTHEEARAVVDYHWSDPIVFDDMPVYMYLLNELKNLKWTPSNEPATMNSRPDWLNEVELKKSKKKRKVTTFTFTQHFADPNPNKDKEQRTLSEEGALPMPYLNNLKSKVVMIRCNYLRQNVDHILSLMEPFGQICKKVLLFNKALLEFATHEEALAVDQHFRNNPLMLNKGRVHIYISVMVEELKEVQKKHRKRKSKIVNTVKPLAKDNADEAERTVTEQEIGTEETENQDSTNKPKEKDQQDGDKDHPNAPAEQKQIKNSVISTILKRGRYSRSADTPAGKRVVVVMGFMRSEGFLDEIFDLAKPFGNVVRYLLLNSRDEILLELETEDNAKSMVRHYRESVVPTVCKQAVIIYHAKSYNTIQSSKVVEVGRIPQNKLSKRTVHKPPVQDRKILYPVIIRPRNEEESKKMYLPEKGIGKYISYSRNQRHWPPLPAIRDVKHPTDPDEKPIDPKKRGKCVVIIIVPIRGRYFIKDILGLARPFGKVRRYLVLKTRDEVFIEFDYEDQARSMVDFFQGSIVTATVSRHLVNIYHAKSFDTIKDELIKLDLPENMSDDDEDNDGDDDDDDDDEDDADDDVDDKKDMADNVDDLTNEPKSMEVEKEADDSQNPDNIKSKEQRAEETQVSETRDEVERAEKPDVSKDIVIEEKAENPDVPESRKREEKTENPNVSKAMTKKRNAENRDSKDEGFVQFSDDRRIVIVAGFNRGPDFMAQIFYLAKPFGKLVQHRILTNKEEAYLELESYEKAVSMVTFYDGSAIPRVCGKPVTVDLTKGQGTIKSPKVVHFFHLPRTRSVLLATLKLARKYGKFNQYRFNRHAYECFIEMERIEDAQELCHMAKAKKLRIDNVPISVRFSRLHYIFNGVRPPSILEKTSTKRKHSYDDRRSRSRSVVLRRPRAKEPSTKMARKRKSSEEPVKTLKKRKTSSKEKGENLIDFYCGVCSVFCSGEAEAERRHCSTKEHNENLQKCLMEQNAEKDRK